MNLKNFKLVKEDPDSYHISHPNGKQMRIAKAGLSEKGQTAIKKMQENPQNFDDGGQVSVNLDNPQIPDSAINPQAGQQSSSFIPQDVFGVSPEEQAQMYQQSQAVQSAGPADSISSSQAMPIPGDGMKQVASDAAAPVSPSNPFQAEKAANTASAKATAAQGKVESQAIQDVQDQIAQMPTQQDIINANKDKNDQLLKAYQDQKLDPNHYMNSLSTGGKIAAGIGMLLSGFGGGAAHQQSMAQQVIQNSINNDIEAQKNDPTKALNLYKMNRDALGPLCKPSNSESDVYGLEV
jgi:hypothetical protein